MEDPFATLASAHIASRGLLLAWGSTIEASVKHDIARRLAALVVSHASLEASHIHPLYVKRLGRAGVAMLAEATESDADINALLHALLHDVDWAVAEGADHAAGAGQVAKANGLVQLLASAIHDHTGREEDHWWPALSATMSPDERAQLLVRLQGAAAKGGGAGGQAVALAAAGQPQQPSAPTAQ